jgi:uncharacterized membrane protein YdjX (TVP38/TMEM64 family)
MKFRLKLILFVFAIVILLTVPYLLWHEEMDAYFASAGFRQRLLAAQSYAWAVGIGLIVSDLMLPIPVPPVMASMGTLYGPILGGIVATVGSILAGLCAYGVTRLLGMKAARFLAGEDELADLQSFFDTWGAAGIVASRALPVVPEVMAVLAGLSRMHFGRFVLALSLGSVPVGFALAWVGGTTGVRSSVLFALTLIPACAWAAYLLIMKRRRGRTQQAGKRDERSGDRA